jgi:hypothetical protein
MRLITPVTGAGLCTSLLLAMSSPASAAVDAKLLEMLKTNGSITQAQYVELQADLANDQKVQQTVAAEKAKKESAWDQKLAWAAKTQIKGDVRVRYENINTEGEPKNGGRDADRERVRARLGVYSEINPQLDAGIRVATGSSADERSTNQDLNNYFTKKTLWMDLAYLDWHPTAINNLHLIGGKMNQPWVNMGDVIWDGDINPEGVAATYKLPLGGSTELFGSTGYYNLSDNVDGEGVQFRHDLRLYTGQLGARFVPIDGVKVTVGGSLYAYDNDKDVRQTSASTNQTALAVNGNTSNQFTLWEGFGQIDLTRLPIPLAFYGQYVKNSDAESTATVGKQDTAWLFGAKTRLFTDWSLDYNYRDVQRNGVVGAFTDSDFANGYTGSRGHKLKVGYDIDKNFALGATYFMAQSDVASRNKRDADVDTLQVDLEAKF